MGLNLWGVYDVNGRVRAVYPHEPVMEDLEAQDTVRRLVASVAEEHDSIDDLVTDLCADLPLGMSRLDAVRFKGRADSLIRGFVNSAAKELK